MVQAWALATTRPSLTAPVRPLTCSGQPTNRLVIGARGHYQPGGVPQHGLGDSHGHRASGERRSPSVFFPSLPACALPTTGAAAWACPAAGTRMSSTTHYSGIATAGGYVGEGVGASFLFGQTLAELLTDQEHRANAHALDTEMLRRRAKTLGARTVSQTRSHSHNVGVWYGGMAARAIRREPFPAKAIGWLCDQLDPH